MVPAFDEEASVAPLVAEVASFRPGGTRPRYGGSPSSGSSSAAPDRQWVLAERDDWDALEDPPALVDVARDRDVRDGYQVLTEAPVCGLTSVDPIQKKRNPRQPLGGFQ